MNRARFVALTILISFIGLGGGRPALADNPQRAKELFQEGTTHFDLGQFDKAIEAWQAGYKEKPDPGFLYNIAQAYRLAGDLNKAIFFYKGYLRNSPKAPNRADVEQRIAALQKQLNDQERSRQTPPAPAPPGPPVTSGTPPFSSPGSPPPPARPPAPQPAATRPLEPTSPDQQQQPPLPSPPPTEVISAEPPSPATVGRPVDLGVAAGMDSWTSGVTGGKAEPSFAVILTGGYNFASAGGSFELRLGLLAGYTFLSEASARDTFLSFLVDPMLRYHLVPRRLNIFGELGIGVLRISGLTTQSVLFTQPVERVSGSLAMLVIRPGLGVEFMLTDGFGVFVSSAVAYSPRRATLALGPIGRLELLLGVTLRL
jgi:hypothetical protein